MNLRKMSLLDVLRCAPVVERLIDSLSLSSIVRLMRINQESYQLRFDVYLWHQLFRRDFESDLSKLIPKDTSSDWLQNYQRADWINREPNQLLASYQSWPETIKLRMESIAIDEIEAYSWNSSDVSTVWRFPHSVESSKCIVADSGPIIVGRRIRNSNYTEPHYEYLRIGRRDQPILLTTLLSIYTGQGGTRCDIIYEHPEYGLILFE